MKKHTKNQTIPVTAKRLPRQGVPLAMRDLDTDETICQCGKRFATGAGYARHWERSHAASVAASRYSVGQSVMYLNRSDVSHLSKAQQAWIKRTNRSRLVVVALPEKGDREGMYLVRRASGGRAFRCTVAYLWGTKGGAR